MTRSLLNPLFAGLGLALCGGVSAFAVGAPPAPIAPATPTTASSGAEFFETKIRPILAEKCYSCHSDKAGKGMGGLKLDTVAGIRKGGDTGPFLAAGKPGAGLLLKALHYDGLRMPPQGQLPAAQVALFDQWASMGAPLPAADAEKKAATGIDIAAGRKHWAFQPVRALPAPKVSTPAWSRKKIDSFVLAKLDAQKLKPSPEADRRTLLRRVYIDLTGLPPTYAEVQAFQADKSPNAYEKVVDHLLASPQYGERWGRHWLDVARYAEDNPTSEATNQPPAFPWRYRDWVIDALNADLPYDQFVRRQLAADLIPGLDPKEQIALGFIGLAPVYHKELQLARDVIEQTAADEWDERVDTISRGFLGLTVACARCHDHKYDPITAKDYYALAGVMASTQLVERPLVDLAPGEAEKLTQAENQIRNLDRNLRRSRNMLRMAANDERKAKLQQTIQETQAKIDEIKKNTPHYGVPMANVVRDAGLWVDGSNPARTKLDYRIGVPRDLPVFIRGSVSRPGEMVPRRFLAVLEPGDPQPFKKGSGRLELADAITHEAAPLSARVIVNRVWGWHFGRGLVDTPSNFGKMGSAPSHPELLTDLAARFIQNGWSLKWLHREIVLSATYRQASVNRAEAYKKDADNRLLWRMNRRRLEPEAWRDSLLEISGDLDDTMGGRSDDLQDTMDFRRTVYGRVSRQRAADVLRLFDFPDPNRHGEVRLSTTTPTQQLYFMNSPFLRQRAERLAEAVLNVAKEDPARLRELYHRVLLRDPKPEEQTLALQLVQSGASADAAPQWTMLAQALLISNESLFAD